MKGERGMNKKMPDTRRCERKHFVVDPALNRMESVGIATACENQCVRCNVNSAKLGRTRN